MMISTRGRYALRVLVDMAEHQSAGYVPLKEVAERAADTFHIRFQYQDFRPLFRQGQERARELGFYIQKYCGCVFSEQERYLKPSKIIR